MWVGARLCWGMCCCWCSACWAVPTPQNAWMPQTQVSSDLPMKPLPWSLGQISLLHLCPWDLCVSSKAPCMFLDKQMQSQLVAELSCPCQLPVEVKASSWERWHRWKEISYVQKNNTCVRKRSAFCFILLPCFWLCSIIFLLHLLLALEVLLWKIKKHLRNQFLLELWRPGITACYFSVSFKVYVK